MPKDCISTNKIDNKKKEQLLHLINLINLPIAIGTGTPHLRQAPAESGHGQVPGGEITQKQTSNPPVKTGGYNITSLRD